MTRRFRPTIALVCGVVVLAFLVIPEARAQDDFLRSSPGPLSRSHASLDSQSNCNDCHTGGKGLSNDKCLDCHDHKDLRDRIRAGKGFHASSKVRGRKCESCHLEHKGRSYDIMGWRSVGGQENFDHDLTGWPLNGKHKAIDCSECHKEKNVQGLRVFLGEDPLCGSCHKRDQPHGFDRRDMMKCERCHNESVWKPPLRRMDFDHNDKKDALMPLEGSHEDVSCGKCHPKAQFNLKPEKPDFCGNCHNSPHDKHLFGEKDCSWCHSPRYRALDKFRFDHARRTRFALGGKHATLDCYNCHTKKMGTQKPNYRCEVCHADDNRHKDRFKQFGSPPRCMTCHPSSSWAPEMFDHNRKTKFPLGGKHAAATCRACHRGKTPSQFERFDPKTVGCMGCHQHTNVHDRKYKDNECLGCHEDAGRIEIDRRKGVEVYHGPNSRFPLVRKHKDVECEKCHINLVFEDTPRECGVRCHQDSLHKGTLGDECSRCHAGGTWDALTFDHTDDTKWPLKGLHKTVPECADCHPKREDYHKTPTNCSAVGCHAKDDAHRGKLGQKCEKCHLETGDNIFNHNTMSVFKLDGKHLTTKCSECHPSVTFKPRPTNCFGCHPEPEVHKGQYGTRCEDCHSTSDWKTIQALHDVGDFSLKGAHDNLACDRCHLDNRPLAGSGNFCLNCHRQDDIHSNSLSPRCGECHTQWSFAPARFDHMTVGCNLTGLHRVLPCYDCHQTGNFGGLSPTCYSCHRDDALPRPTHAGYITCGQCHNPNSWLGLPGQPNSQGIQTTGFGRESICR